MPKKKSKLTEKPARMPDAFESQKVEVINEYLKNIQQKQSEHGKSLLFSHLIRDLFVDIKPQFIEEYSQGVEKFVKLKRKDLIIRGRMDAFYGNLVIEFENSLQKSLSEAEDQLKKYASCLWQKSMGESIPYICIATDGLLFNVYIPKIKDTTDKVIPENTILEKVEELNFLKAEPLQIYFFLDRYIVRKEIRHPTTEEFTKDFGMQSVAFKFVSTDLSSIWEKIKNKPSYQVIFENWESYLKIAYGTSITDEELFIKHTYLASLSKILVWQKLVETKSSSFRELKEVLAGDYFKKIGIVNFLEEDFFSWVVRKEAWEECKETIKKLFNQLLGYNLRELSEDVFKGLYQELVDPKTRHDLGEYYTPDWLAEKMTSEVLEDKPRLSVLDPACGSGTFLYMTIKYKRVTLGESAKTLNHIVSSVAGIDIHPLAVIISKTNYLLALGDLLKKRKGSLVIPIYLANSIRTPILDSERQLALDEKAESYPVHLLEKEAHIPKQLFLDRNLYDQTIEELITYARYCTERKEKLNLEDFSKYIKQRVSQIRDDEVIQTIYHLSKVLKELLEEDRDTIWAFVLKNVYKPVFLQGKFDIVVGNPPWLSYRYIEKGEYQTFIKRQIKDYWLLQIKQVELITHLELATLFFVRSVDLYLKPKGNIAFVMPRSIFVADHHNFFRIADLRIDIGYQQIWDLDQVKPLFNIPACVVFGKKNRKTKYPIKDKVFEGRLDSRNERLIDAEEKLKIETKKLDLRIKGNRSYWTTGEEIIIAGEPSPYKKLFKQGATIVPRSFWFVEPKISALGFDTSRPYLQTDRRAIKTAKDKFKDVFFEGKMERKFLYASLLSTDLVPFGHLPFRLVVLPIESQLKGFKLLTQANAREKGHLELGGWLESVESEWRKLKGKKGEKINAVDWLNYRNKLTNQQKSKFKVLYPASGTNVFGLVLNCEAGFKINLNGSVIYGKDLLIDYTSYYFETDRENEAYYLSAFLNSNILNSLIKPLQARGLFGPRHIVKKVWEFPIPRYDPKKPNHKKLTVLGKEASQKVENFLEKKSLITSIGRVRRDVKNHLKNELKEIDKIAKAILEIDKLYPEVEKNLIWKR